MTYPKSFLQLLRQVKPSAMTDQSTAPQLALEEVEPTRYARWPDGYLAQRDTDILRNYLDEAPTDQEREDRQNALFNSASAGMSLAPKPELLPTATYFPRDGHQPTVGVNVDLCFMPVVFTTPRSLNMGSRFALDHASCSAFTRALQEAIFQACPTELFSIRVESLISIQDLAGVSPLTIKSAIDRETQRNQGSFKKTNIDIPPELVDKRLDKWREHQGNWSLQLHQSADVQRMVGPSQPAAFLLAFFASCDLRNYPHNLRSLSAVGLARVQELLRHFLTHDHASEFGERGKEGGNSVVQVHVGTVNPAHLALVQAQFIQLQWASDLAAQKGVGFSFDAQQTGSHVRWRATQHGLDGDGDPLDQPIIDFGYDTSWRPQSHIQAIQQAIQTEPLKDFSSSRASASGSDMDEEESDEVRQSTTRH